MKNPFSKNPSVKLQKQYESLMRDAMNAQRGGDIVKSSELHAQAEEILKQLDQMKG